MEYTFERIAEKHYKDLCRLSQCAFGIKKTESFFRNKFNTEYLWVTHLGYIAYDEHKEPAAFYGVYPQLMTFGGERYLAAQSGDTMTDPKHGGRGLFTQLARMTYQLAKENGIQFIFGFPNENSYPGFVKKLNWTHRENMINYERRVTTFPLAALCKKIRFLFPLYQYYQRFVLQFFASKRTIVHNSVTSKNTGGVFRNDKFMHYKKSCGDNYITRLGKAAAWLKVDGALLIGDVDLSGGADLTEVLKGVNRLAFLLGCNRILFPVSPGTLWDEWLQGKMTPQKGIYIGYLDLQSGLPLDRFKYTLADFDTF